MGESIKIILWQNIPSIHQAPLVSELAKQSGARVVVVAERPVPMGRLHQGWHQPEFGQAELIIAPSQMERLNIMAQAGNNCIHLFSGLRAYRETFWTLRQLAQQTATLVIFAEPVDDQGLLGPLKLLRYRYDALRWRRRINLLLITSERGRRWYGQRGFPMSIIAPFAYFPDLAELKQPTSNLPERDTSDQVDLLFLGQLIPRKGVDLLLRSLSQLQDYPWMLSIAGGGTHQDTYKHLARRLGIAARVAWLGPVPNSQIHDLLASADCLILPSRFDGWGAVVNEALLAGTPALVSEACGSSELVQTGNRGLVFAAHSEGALTQALADHLAQGTTSPEHRMAIQEWARKSIAPAVGARHLLRVFDQLQRGCGSLPMAPWLQGAIPN